jgi:hypothetical protein
MRIVGGEDAPKTASGRLCIQSTAWVARQMCAWVSKARLTVHSPGCSVHRLDKPRNMGRRPALARSSAVIGQTNTHSRFSTWYTGL